MYVVALLAPAPARADSALPPDAEARAKAVLCTDGKSHYVALVPDPQRGVRIHYGDGKRFLAIPPDPSRMLPGEDFLDPRYFNKTANPNFRGIDFRLYSSVEHNQDKKTCAVRCGERTTPLQIVATAEAEALLAAAKWEPSPRKWTPYAIARDNDGSYYYVDHGIDPETDKRFRLFVGPKGALKEQKMINVVSDSEGDIFATKTGSLRLILNKNESSWVRNKKPTKLLLIPVMENLAMIYNELGIYRGERLGTPCDDL